MGFINQQRWLGILGSLHVFLNLPHLGFLHFLYVFSAQEEDQVSAAEDVSDAPISEFEASPTESANKSGHGMDGEEPLY